MRELLSLGAGGHCDASLQGFCGRGVASGRGGRADREAACAVLLTVAVLFLTWLTGLDLSVSSSLHVVERSDMNGVERKERLPVREKMVVSWGRKLCQTFFMFYAQWRCWVN